MRPRRAGSLAVVLAVVLGAACAQNASGPAPAARPASPAAPDALAADGVFTVVTPCGFRVVVNDGDAHFTVDLDGTLAHGEEKGDATYLAMDDLIVQVVHASHAQIGAAAAGKSGLDFLRAHEAWEASYLSEHLGTRIEPREINFDSKGTAQKLDGIVWWFPLADKAGPGGVAIHRSWAYVTIEMGDHVVGLSALAERGLEPTDVMGRLLRWVSTLKASPSRLAPGAVSAAVKAASEREQKCPALESTLGIDRRLRLDEIPRGARDGVGRAAEEWGGVERQVIDNRLRYRNHVCRFEFTYPDDEWKDFLVRDLSDSGCMVNVATPLVYDPDARQKITNAVVLTVARPIEGFGAAEMQAQLVDTLSGKGARFTPAKKALVEGALGVSYTAEDEGTHFVGEIATVRRGDLLYSIHFNATRGTVLEGRKNLARWLAGLRLDVP